MTYYVLNWYTTVVIGTIVFHRSKRHTIIINSIIKRIKKQIENNFNLSTEWALYN